MKKLLTLSIILSLIIQANSQIKEVKVTDAVATYDNTEYKSTGTTLSGSVDKAMDAWEQFVKQQYDFKASKKGNIVKSEEIKLPEVSNKRGDLIAIFVAKGNDVDISITYRLGYDICIEPTLFPTEYEKLKVFTTYFGYYFYDYLHAAEIKKISDKIANYNKEIKKLYSDNSSMTNSNNKNMKNIENKNKKITELQTEIDQGKAQKVEKNVNKINKLKADVNESSGEISINDSKIKNNLAEVDKIKIKINEENTKLEEQTGIRSKYSGQLNEYKNNLKN